jgi:hypothetical protein
MKFNLCLVYEFLLIEVLSFLKLVISGMFLEKHHGLDFMKYHSSFLPSIQLIDQAIG